MYISKNNSSGPAEEEQVDKPAEFIPHARIENNLVFNLGSRNITAAAPAPSLGLYCIPNDDDYNNLGFLSAVLAAAPLCCYHPFVIIRRRLTKSILQ